MPNQDSTFKERFDHLIKVIASNDFLSMKTVGNEIPFFIFPFNTNETDEIKKFRRNLINKVSEKGVSVLDIDLYSVCLEILKERNIMNELIENEASIPKDAFRQQLQSVLQTQKHIIPKVSEKMESTKHDTMFLSGIGELFPIVKAENFLNNLHKIAYSRPTVIFFPGNFSETVTMSASLDLFGILKDDNYYRAFNILHFEV